MKNSLKTILKTTAAAMLAVMAVMPSASVFAADIKNAVTTNETEIAIAKEIRARNYLATSVGGNTNDSLLEYVSPSVTFLYTIKGAQVDEGTKIQGKTSDGTDKDMILTSGPYLGLVVANDLTRTDAAKALDDASNKTYGANVTFTSAATTKNDKDNTAKDNASPDESTKVIEKLQLKVDLDKFDKPGVYRYEIKDVTPTKDLFNAGIIRTGNFNPQNTYLDTRYLDIYIESYEENGKIKQKVAGYVLMKNNETVASKSEGFTTTDKSGYDSYRNYYSSVTKNIDGNMADVNAKFNFTANVENKINGVQLKYYYAINDNPFQSTTDETLNVVLGNNDVLKLRGLSPYAEIQYQETIQESDTLTYDAKATSGNITAQTAILATGSISAKESIETETFYISNYANELNKAVSIGNDQTTNAYYLEKANTADNVSATAEEKGNPLADVTFVNTVEAISPTGVLLRFAPFVILVGFALALLAVSRKTRTNEKKTRSI